MWRVSHKVFFHHMTKIWTFTDIATVLLAMIAASLIRSRPGQFLQGLNALVAGLLWLRVLGYCTVVNKKVGSQNVLGS